MSPVNSDSCFQPFDKRFHNHFIPPQSVLISLYDNYLFRLTGLIIEFVCIVDRYYIIIFGMDQEQRPGSYFRCTAESVYFPEIIQPSFSGMRKIRIADYPDLAEMIYQHLGVSRITDGAEIRRAGTGGYC
jgi:hypothetical protein